ncbi:MAG: hypothetical protein ACLGP3_05740, partial [Acidobacteriota bacterium]
LRFGELTALVPLSIIMFAMGVAPMLLLHSIQSGVHPPPAPQQARSLPASSPALSRNVTLSSISREAQR